MNKQAIISAILEKHGSFVAYIRSLSSNEMMIAQEGKWNAVEQLAHIVLCVKPILQVFSMDKAMIGQNFGVADKPSRTFDHLKEEYVVKLNEGGKAPSRFVPQTVLNEEYEMLCKSLTELAATLGSKINDFSEDELDMLCIPHPLLGKLTLREMLFNAIAHVAHHHELTRLNVETRP